MSTYHLAPDEDGELRAVADVQPEDAVKCDACGKWFTQIGDQPGHSAAANLARHIKMTHDRENREVNSRNLPIRRKHVDMGDDNVIPIDAPSLGPGLLPAPHFLCSIIEHIQTCGRCAELIRHG